MAKIETKNDDVIIIDDNATKEAPKKSEAKDTKVTLVSDETKAKLEAMKADEVVIEKQEDRPVAKNVKIVLIKNHKCSIGGNWYSFTAGKQYIVPENVKTILRDAGLLAPL